VVVDVVVDVVLDRDGDVNGLYSFPSPSPSPSTSTSTSDVNVNVNVNVNDSSVGSAPCLFDRAGRLSPGLSRTPNPSPF
jgi:hypothetical protein